MVDAIDARPPEQPQSPTIKNIIEGKANFQHIGKDGFFQQRPVRGKDFPGMAHAYTMTVPSPSKPNELWTTEVTVWTPSSMDQRKFEPRPSSQIYINTGHGEMRFTENPDEMNKILAEISRQMTEQRLAEEAEKAKKE